MIALLIKMEKIRIIFFSSLSVTDVVSLDSVEGKRAAVVKPSSANETSSDFPFDDGSLKCHFAVKIGTFVLIAEFIPFSSTSLIFTVFTSIIDSMSLQCYVIFFCILVFFIWSYSNVLCYIIGYFLLDFINLYHTKLFYLIIYYM